MGCGASAVKEQAPRSGPVGSAASMARWKRSQQTQPKLVECSLPTSIEELKANDKEAPSEVETNCGESSTDEAYTENGSRPVSRESMVSNSASHLSDNEMKCRQLRLQLSKACVLAAKSGDLRAALQQVTSKSQSTTEGTIAAPTAAPSSKSQSTTECIIAPPSAAPSSRRPQKKKSNAAVAVQLETDGKAQETEIDRIKRKAAEGLSELFSKPDAVEGLLASASSNQAANCKPHKEDMDSLKSQFAEHLQRCAESGTLERMLQESMEGISKPKDSEQLSKDTSNDLDTIRRKAANILEKSVSSGTFQKIMMTEPPKSDDYQRIRQKAASALMNAASSGSLDGIVAASKSNKSNKVDDNAVTAIRQRAALSFVKAAQSRSLADAFSTITVRENLRKTLEGAYGNGSLDKAVTDILQETTEKKSNDIEEIRQKAKASLEDFLRSAA